jgi:DNA replication protein DnaC
MYPPLKPVDMKTRWQHANLPKQNWGSRLEDFRPYDPDSALAKAAVERFVETFETRLWTDDRDLTEPGRGLVGRGLLLVGNPGTCKTLLACMAMTEVHLQHKRNIRFVATASYIKALTESLSDRKQADLGIPDAIEKYYAFVGKAKTIRTRPLLTLDDMGKEHHTSTRYAQGELDMLVRDRYTDGLPTIITTNTSTEKWAAVYSPSMRSFIEEAYDIVVLPGADQRRRTR